MKQIPLTQGKFALIDDEDFPQIQPYNWYYNQGYAVRKSYKDGREVKILMHRIIINATKGLVVDHINFDGLDNRKENLRLVSSSFNRRHRRKQTNNTNGFIGVSKAGNKWKTSVGDSGKYVYLGTYSTPEEASRAFQNYTRKLWEEAGHEYIPVSEVVNG